MKESLIGSVVNTVTGTVSSAANALTGASATSGAADSDSSSTTEATSAPASSTSTPTTAATITPSPSPSSSTSAHKTTVPASTTSVPTTTIAADSSSGESASNTSDTAATNIATTSPPSTTTQASNSDNNDDNMAIWSESSSSLGSRRSTDTWSESGSSLGSRGSGSDTSASVGDVVGSNSQGGGEAGVTAVSDEGLSTDSIIGLTLGAAGTMLVLVVLLSWCLRRKQTQRLSSCALGQVSLGATGNLPIVDTGGTERFATSSTSMSLGPFQTANQLSASDSKSSSRWQSSGLWDDEVITAMRVPLEKLNRMALVSSGGYGDVYRGVYHDETVAMKVLLPEKQKDMEHINAFLAEIKMMASIDHPSIVRFIGVAWDSLSDLTAVLEFMEGGDLRSLLYRFEQEHRPRGFDLDKAQIALQTAQAVTYLHSLDPKVLHRDLKSRNILLTSKLEAKVSDFGVSRKYSFSSMTAVVGTSLWMAPEVMMGERYDASADIFSFGVVLSELDSHLLPYADARTTSGGQRVPDAALLQLVAMGRVRINFSTAAPKALVELGHACVSLDPAARPSASEVHYQLQLLVQTYDVYTL